MTGQYVLVEGYFFGVACQHAPGQSSIPNPARKPITSIDADVKATTFSDRAAECCVERTRVCIETAGDKFRLSTFAADGACVWMIV
jgi:hypothetical protein